MIALILCVCTDNSLTDWLRILMDILYVLVLNTLYKTLHDTKVAEREDAFISGNGEFFSNRRLTTCSFDSTCSCNQRRWWSLLRWWWWSTLEKRYILFFMNFSFNDDVKERWYNIQTKKRYGLIVLWEQLRRRRHPCPLSSSTFHFSTVFFLRRTRKDWLLHTHWNISCVLYYRFYMIYFSVCGDDAELISLAVMQ